MSVIEGDTGVIVIDPLISKETAAAAFALYTEHRGDRPVVAMIYTHSHIDHFGGVKGIITEDDVASGRGPGDRPRGVHAPRRRRERVRRHRDGPPSRLHVRRRARARARPARSAPASARPPRPVNRPLIPPTVDITHTGQELTIDGVRDRLPGDPRHRGAGRDELLLPAASRAVHGREHLAHAAQHPHHPRRRGPRRPRLGALPHRDDRPVGRRARRGVRLAPLAHLGSGARGRVPRRCSATCTCTCTTRPCG